MTTSSAPQFLALALVPLLLVLGSAHRPADIDAGARAGDGVRLELATLRAEARSMTVHIDGP